MTRLSHNETYRRTVAALRAMGVKAAYRNPRGLGVPFSRRFIIDADTVPGMFPGDSFRLVTKLIQHYVAHNFGVAPSLAIVRDAIGVVALGEHRP